MTVTVRYLYSFPFCGLPVVKVGINFDSESHTLSDWIIEGIDNNRSCLNSVEEQFITADKINL